MLSLGYGTISGTCRLCLRYSVRFCATNTKTKHNKESVLGSETRANANLDEAFGKSVRNQNSQVSSQGDLLQYSKLFVPKPDEGITQPNPCAIEPSQESFETKLSEKTVSNPQWTPVGRPNSPKALLKEVLALGKIRLTSLVVLSSMGGFAIAPVDLSFYTFSGLSLGVLMTSMCANSINQFLEAPYDAQMVRTQNRPLVKRSLTPQTALLLASLFGVSGTCILLSTTNLTTALLGVTNILLYTCVYTPLKRKSVVNTWVGSLVGALPPLMGWTAATGSLACPAALVMPLVLYSWQFPHFNALSWNLRGDYSRAGYQMMSVTDPALSKRVAFRHTLLLFPICLAAPLSGLTMWFFAFDSSILNAYFAYLGYQFYKHGDSKSARALFRFSLIYLPLVVGLMLCSKYWDCFMIFKDAKQLSITDPRTYHVSRPNKVDQKLERKSVTMSQAETT